MQNKLKHIIACFLLVIFVLQVTSKFIVVVDYWINKDYIAKNLCENKAKPKMHCDGKCHLAKQIDKQEKKEKPTKNSLKEKQASIYFCSVKADFQFSEISVNQNEKNLFGFKNKFKDQFIGSIKQPPKV